MINRRGGDLPAVVLIPIVNDRWAQIACICHENAVIFHSNRKHVGRGIQRKGCDWDDGRAFEQPCGRVEQ